MKKDFLFLTASEEIGGGYSIRMSKEFDKLGYDIDIFQDNNLNVDTNIDYKVVFTYIPESSPRNISNTVNRLLGRYRDSFIVYYDNSDHSNFKRFFNSRLPDLILKREFVKTSVKVYENIPTYPIYFFGTKDIYNEELNNNKIYDVCFLGNMTHERRLLFANKINDLSNNSLSHLKWKLDIKQHGQDSGKNFSGWNRTEDFNSILNQSKVCLNYYGNAYDSTRTWEILSAAGCMVAPPFIHMSYEDMNFDNYIEFKEDCSDLEEKILYALENNRYSDYGKKSREEYLNKHTIEKRVAYIVNLIHKHGNVL